MASCSHNSPAQAARLSPCGDWSAHSICGLPSQELRPTIPGHSGGTMKRIPISAIATIMLLCGIKVPTAKKPVRKQISTNGTFKIVVRPTDAEVLIDKKDVGPGSHAVTPNVYHNVTVSRDGYIAYSRDTYARRGRTRRLNVVLMKKEEWYGALPIRNNPSDHRHGHGLPLAVGTRLGSERHVER